MNENWILILLLANLRPIDHWTKKKYLTNKCIILLKPHHKFTIVGSICIGIERVCDIGGDGFRECGVGVKCKGCELYLF